MTQNSAEVETMKAAAPSASKARWWIFIGLSIYLVVTSKNSLLGLIVGVIGDAGGGSLEIQQRIMLLVLGANFPLTVAALVLCAIGLRWPPMKTRLVLCLFGGGAACIIFSILGDALFELDLY